MSLARLVGLGDILGGGGGYVKNRTSGGGYVKNRNSRGYQNLSRHGKNPLFINAATRREIPFQQGIIASSRE